MAEDEITLRRRTENVYRNEQIDHAIATLTDVLKVHPESIAMQNLLQQYQYTEIMNIPDNIQQETEELKQTKIQNETKLDQVTRKYNIEQDINEIKQKNGNDTEIEEKLYKIANNSFQMRLKILRMELKVFATFLMRGLIENGNDIRTNTNNVEKCVGIACAALDVNNFERIEKQLHVAESLSTELMRKIKIIVKKNTVKKEEVKKPEEDIQVPDYRSIVTVRGTKEDVANCILKAKTALDNGKYDRAESLLLKAERIFPTKNARDLLKQVRAAKEPKQNSDPTENSIESVEIVNIVKEKKEESKSEDNGINATKCLRAFEEAFTSGNFVKAERLLNKAKRFDPELNVEEKFFQVKTAINKKIVEEKRREEIEKAKTECKSAGKCLYKSIKAYSAGDFEIAEQILFQTKLFDPMLNLEPELSTIRDKMASKGSKENKDTDKTEPEKTVTESDIEYAAGYLYNAKKAFETGDFKEAQRNLFGAKTFDPSLDLEPYFSKCRAEIASRSSTEGNAVIPKKVPNTVTTNTKEGIGLCKRENIERLKKEVIEKEKPKMKKDDQLETKKNCEDQKGSLNNQDGNTYMQVKKDGLLLKAERKFPTKNAWDFLKQVRAANEPKRNSDPTETSIQTIEIANTVKEKKEKSKSEDNSINTAKCLRASEEAFTSGNFVKAERLLNKAKRFDPELNVEEKVFQVKTAINQKIVEEKRREEIEKAKTECDSAGKCLYKSIKAYGTGDFEIAEQILFQTKLFDPMLNLEPELSTIRDKMASKGSKENKDTDKTEPEKTVIESDIEYAAGYLYNAKKAFETGDFKEAQRNLFGAKKFDPSLDLEPYFSKCRAKITSRSSTERNTVITKNVPGTVTTCTKDIELCKQNERHKEVVETKKSKIKKNDQLEIKKEAANRIKLQEVEQLVKQARHCMSSGELEQAKEFLLKAKSIYATSIVKSLMEQVEKDLEKLKKSYHCSKYNADFKTSKTLQKEEQAKTLMVENAIHNKNFEDDMHFLNSAEDLYPTKQTKELMKIVNANIVSRDETSVRLNCYEFPVEANESDKAEALKCRTMAQAAFEEGHTSRAEHLLLKSLRICENQKTKTFLETVRKAKADVKTEKSYHDHVNDHSVNESNCEYNKSIDLTEKATAQGASNAARKHLEHIQNIKSSHHNVTTSKTDDDLILERETEMFINLGFEAMTTNKLNVARIYLEYALKKQPNEKTRELLRDVQIQMDNGKGRHSPSKLDFIYDANKLLDKADNLIRAGDLEKAEPLLIISWDMNRSQRAISDFKKFLEARLDLFKKNNYHKRGRKKCLRGRNAGKFRNVFKSDKLVKLALDKNKKNKFDEAEKLLIKAADLNSNVNLYPINKQLVEIRRVQNGGDQ